MTECVFCAIAAGRAPASIVHSDDLTVAFMDIRPVNPGHTLVIPRQHAPTMRDVDPRSWAAVWKAVKQVQSALYGTAGIRCEGVNVFVADTPVAGQEVPHFHVHILPRYRGDEFGLRLPPGYGPIAERPVLEQQGDGIRAALATIAGSAPSGSAP
jgi:histidine triad (HIT) family protein